MIKEIWKPIKGYEGYYEVSNLGEVRSCVTTTSRRKGLIKPHLKNGYLAVNLFNDKSKCKHHYIHRLVAEAFILKIPDYKIVNHIDCNKMNNSADNLEYCTQKYNIHHSIENGLQHRRYKTIVDGREYSSMNEASLIEFDKTYNLINLMFNKLGSEFTYKGKYIKVVMPNV